MNDSGSLLIGALGIVATACVGIFAPIASGRAQRSLAREERQQARRAEAYVDLLDFAIREKTRVGLTFPQVSFGNENDLMPSTIEEDAWWRMHARINAFGSAEVRATVDKLLTDRHRFRASVGHVAEMKKMSVPGDRDTVNLLVDARREMEARRSEILELCDELVAVVNHELAPQP